jgi:hypothetical protein
LIGIAKVYFFLFLQKKLPVFLQKTLKTLSPQAFHQINAHIFSTISSGDNCSMQA